MRHLVRLEQHRIQIGIEVGFDDVGAQRGARPEARALQPSSH